MKIFIAEDEIDIINALEYNFKKENFEVKYSTDGQDAFKKIINTLPDLIILDIMLPKLDGLSLCKDLREKEETKNIPIIMLTARSTEMDKIIGLENGADDYITKPFSIKELIARIKALLRRNIRETKINNIKLGDLYIDFSSIKVLIKNKEIKITAKEFLILRYLLENKDKVISREALLEKIWDLEKAFDLDTRTIDMHIMNLRKKLGKYGNNIITVKNFGYKWEGNA